MNASELTFGVEIETLIPMETATRNGLIIGGYHSGVQVPYLPAGWKAERDGSLSSSIPNRVGCEIVSPILRGQAGLVQVAKVIETLVAKGHRVNSTCGVHVHVGWNLSNPAFGALALARLITIVAYLEKGIYAITGTKARERGRFCKGVRVYGDDKAAKNRMDGDRYHILNLANLARGRKPTVEFRAFSGSLEVVKVLGWIQVCLGLVERALVGKRSPKWNPAPIKAGGGWAKGGVGACDTERLISFLAWSDAVAKVHHGRRYGWLGAEQASLSCPSEELVKVEFRRLAKKYDDMP